jgi:hypothetical protein
MTKALATSALLALFFASLMPLSCSSFTCVTGKGAVIKKEVSVAAFTGIDLQGSLDVKLTMGAVQSVRVEAQENLVDLLETTLVKGVWHIRTSACYRTDKPFVVHITVPGLNSVVVQGSGDVESVGIVKGKELDLEVQGSGDIQLAVDAEQVKASVQGSGTIKLSGTCNALTASVQGSGDVKAGNLVATDASATIMGSGDVTVQAMNKLDANVTGSGDVKYKGKPAQIKTEVVGSGTVVPVKE